MATGDMPPGSKQNLFVHDPKVSKKHPIEEVANVWKEDETDLGPVEPLLG